MEELRRKPPPPGLVGSGVFSIILWTLTKMTYESVLTKLMNAGRRASGINMPSQAGLARTRLLLTKMALPQQQQQQFAFHNHVVHVVGTNGKGTAAWKINNALSKLPGFPLVGMYTSPHLFSVRERIRVNGQCINEHEFKELGERALCAAEEVGGATYFELVTCIALQHFATKQCNAVVLEAGMGGLGDATNVLPCCRVVCLTHIGLDHVRVLGNSVEEICKEKLGVIKPGSRVVIGPSVPRELDVKIMEQARQLGAYSVKRLMFTTTAKQVEQENGLIAKACLEEFGGITFEDDDTGIRPSCRIESYVDHLTQKKVVLDVGHNPSALQRVFNEVLADNPASSTALVFAIAQDKDLQGCVDAISKHKWHTVIFCKPSALKSRKFTEPQVLQNILPTAATVTSNSSASQAIRNCLNNADIRTVICCGSHALMKEAVLEVTNKVPQICDPFDSNERGAFDDDEK